MHLTKRGDARIVQLLCDRLRHEDGYVREAVALMVGNLASIDNPKVILALKECALNSEARVRSAVKTALEGVIRVVDSRAISTLAASLMSIDGDSRRDAVQAFLRMVESEHDPRESREKEHREALWDVGALLEDTCQTVRETAMFTIEAITDRRQIFGNSEVGTLKWDRDPQLLQARQLLVQRLAICLGEQDFLLRHVAQKMIPAIAQPGDALAVCAVVANVHHESWQVRVAALQLLPSLARASDAHVVHLAVERLRDESSSVREQAIEFIRACHHLTKKELLISEVGELLADRDLDTRDAAVDALHALAPLSKAAALGALQVQLEHPNWHVRKTCVSALGRFILAGILPCNSAAFRRVEALLNDDSWLVRNAAASTLGGMIEYSRSDGMNLVAFSESASPCPEDLENSNKSSHRGSVEQAMMPVRGSLTETNLQVPSSRLATTHTSHASTRVTSPAPSSCDEDRAVAITSAVAALRSAALEDLDCRVQQAAADMLNRVSVEEACA